MYPGNNPSKTLGYVYRDNNLGDNNLRKNLRYVHLGYVSLGNKLGNNDLGKSLGYGNLG